MPTTTAQPNPIIQRAIKTMLGRTYEQIAEGIHQGVFPDGERRLTCLVVRIAHEAFRAGIEAQADAETARLLGPYNHDWSATEAAETAEAREKIARFPIPIRN